MKNKYGNIRRVFMTEKPMVYNRETRIAYMDFVPDTQVKTSADNSESAKGKNGSNVVEGFSGFVVQTDGIIDYGHLKSLLIEAGYPQKEEHAISINTISALISKINGKELSDDAKNDIATFEEFDEYRCLCANCARAIMDIFKV
uniref:hypothetical protein n=1 Tax=Prevotella sp. TaxID=59823 RepID=UPI00402571FF